MATWWHVVEQGNTGRDEQREGQKVRRVDVEGWMKEGGGGYYVGVVFCDIRVSDYIKLLVLGWEWGKIGPMVKGNIHVFFF